MTREEAADYLSALKVLLRDIGIDTEKVYSAIDASLSTLRPISREQVEKAWRGCEYCSDDCPPLDWQFGLDHILPNYKYCPMCGAPMTDEAVQIVMERLEALHDTGN